MLENIKMKQTKIKEKDLLSRNVKNTFDKLKISKVCILGLGGLGSNVAVLLARAGVGNLQLVDFDVVEVSNLNRQQYKISHIGMRKTKALKEIIEEINPFVKVEIFDMKIDNKNLHLIVKNNNIVVEAFDNAELKAMLVEEILTNYTDKILISASGMGGLGSSNEISTKKIRKNLYLIGDSYSDCEEFLGIMSSRVMLCASHQANLVLRLILGEEKEEI